MEGVWNYISENFKCKDLSGKEEKIGLHCILFVIYTLALPLTITKLSGGASILKLIALPIGAYFLATSIFDDRKFKLNYVHFFLVLFTFSAVFTLFSTFNQTTVYLARGYIETTVLTIIMTMRKYNRREIRIIEISNILLGVILILLGFFSAEATVGMDRESIVIFGAACDPNYFVGFFILPAAIWLREIERGNLYRKLAALCMFAFAFYVILKTGSRGGTISFLFLIGIYMVFFNIKPSTKIMLLCIAVCFLVFAFLVIMPLLPETVAKRYTLEYIAENGTTHRTDIWREMWQTIKKGEIDFMIGRGLSSTHEVIIDGNKYNFVAHNQFIQMWYDQGIIGVIIFYTMVLCVFFRNFKKRRYISMAMVAMMVLTLSLSIIPSFKFFWNLIMYGALNFEEDDRTPKIN